VGFFSAELESMVELYQRETAGLMEEFDAKQSGAMQNGCFTAQDINAVFRVVHTIKSSAAMMGLADISSCTHRMEDLFLLFRDKPERSVGFENRIFDLMYLFSDFVENENAVVAKKDFRPKSARPVIDAIQKELDFFKDGPGSPAEKEEPDAADTGAPVIREPAAEAAEELYGPGELIWRVTLRPNCQMENVRAYMLVRQLEEICGKIGTQPANLESPDAAARIVRDGLVLTLHAAHAEEAAQRLSASPYVLRVEEIGNGAPETDAGPDADGASDDADALQTRQNKFSMVSWSNVMQLQNITGELITANTILGASIKKYVQGGTLENEFQTMKRLFHELEKLVAAVSMMPVSSVVPQYQRLVRDVAAREQKQIRLAVVGAELEVDRNLLDTLGSPLIHLLRNAADHGIEAPEARAAAGKDACGTVTLKFENLTDHLAVTVADDGGGMDPRKLLRKAAERGLLTKEEGDYSADEILNLAFLPGLSTNEQTNQYSGRGVGMDVAQNVVSSLGGSVTIHSAPGEGTAIRMEVPVSVTSSECLKFMVGPHACLIPIRCVVRILSLAEAEEHLHTAEGRSWLQAEEMLPVLDLFELYGVQPGDEGRRLVIIRDARGSAALLTGPVTGQQTAVEKPLPALIGRDYRTKTGMVGCTVTETGKLGVMLNADWLLRMCGKDAAENGN